jgi:hypothetical protein
VGGQVRLFARKPHYRDHLRPIWDLLPDEYKLTGEWGRFDWLLIAGGPDIRHGHPYVYVEHGAGQSYRGYTGPGYSGGSGHDECKLFVCPNDEVAGRWQVRYPDIPAVVVGCPRLDRYHTGYEPPERTVAITFHFDLRIVPETRSAFPHYRDGLANMIESYREQGWTVLGHAHPRYRRVLGPVWRSLNVEWTDHPLRDVAVLIADNTSLQAEFLSCGRPVVALNAPWYRRDVWHGGRFWDWSVQHVESSQEAANLRLGELKRPTSHPYAFADGKAAERAATAIQHVLSGT